MNSASTPDKHAEDRDNNDRDDSSSSNNHPEDPVFDFNPDVLRDRIANLDDAASADANQGSSSDNNNNVYSIYSDSSSQYVAEESAHFPTDDPDESKYVESFNNMRKAWVILFTRTEDGTEGIYSLSIGGSNIVLAFEDKYEANRYVISLEAQQFPKPQIVQFDTDRLKNFCSESNLKLGFVPKGKVIVPPEASVVDNLDNWRGKHSNSNSDAKGMTQDDIDAMRKRLDSLFGQ